MEGIKIIIRYFFYFLVTISIFFAVSVRGEDKTVHPPYKTGCEACHTPDFKSLVSKVPDLCYGCHNKIGSKAHVHSPAKEGLCTACHHPHESPNPKLILSPIPDLCYGCHNKLDSKAHVHDPVKAGMCISCHQSHESMNPKLVISQVPDLCYGCHNKIGSKAHVHNPVKAGMCTSCHDPHSSSNQKLILSPVPDLCYGCHSDIKDNVSKSRYPHQAINIGSSCMACHDPHETEKTMILKNDGMNLCLGCHSSIKEFLESSLERHGPIKGGDCTSCHNPHGSGNFKMLKAEFPAAAYSGFDSERYSLCFICHESKVFKSNSDLTTGFRDGNKNLHYIHVNGNKGRTCRACHDPHASRKLKLMKETFSFGSWNQPINFEKRDDGGSCSAVCHMPKAYRR